MGWLYIRLLQAVGLAKVREQQGDLQTDADKTQIDKDTLTALVTHRFQLMDRYWREVVLPVFQDEKYKANEISQQNLFRHGRKLLVLEDMMISDKTKSRLQALIKDSTALKTVYEYRLKLQALWDRKKTNTNVQGDMLRFLQEWCKQAEETGIKVLQDFAMRLKGYSLSSVQAM